MEALKKTAVLISGLLIIILVTWILSLSSDKSNDVKQKEKIESQSQKPSAQKDDTTGEDSFPAAPGPGAKKRSTEQDTIAWRTFSDVERDKKYTFSDKTPLPGNPNPVFISAAKQILPAVVSIRSSRRIKHPSMDFFPHLKSGLLEP